MWTNRSKTNPHDHYYLMMTDFVSYLVPTHWAKCSGVNSVCLVRMHECGASHVSLPYRFRILEAVRRVYTLNGGLPATCLPNCTRATH